MNPYLAMPLSSCVKHSKTTWSEGCEVQVRVSFCIEVRYGRGRGVNVCSAQMQMHRLDSGPLVTPLHVTRSEVRGDEVQSGTCILKPLYGY